MARWFKHSALASMEMPVRDILAKYGYAGVGVYWMIVERVALSEGEFTFVDLVRQFKCKAFTSSKIKELIFNFGCFDVSDKGKVTLRADSDSSSDSSDAFFDRGKGEGNSSNARTRNREDKKREEERERRVPAPSTVVPLGHRMRMDWVDEMKGRKGDVYFEMVCMKSGFGRLLSRYWDVAWDMYRSQVVLLGKDKDYCSESDVKTHFMYFVTHSPTHGEVMAALKEIADSNEDTDYMSTYTGPPLPEDAPPRPSHTAVYNENRNEWVEPR